MQRNLLATLAFSLGVPMLSHGDELGRTQLGNNNAYCQDGPLTWVDWSPSDAARELLGFTRHVFELRRTHPVLRRRHFFTGSPSQDGSPKDLVWLRPDGAELSLADWKDPERRALGMLIWGEAHDDVDAQGRRVRCDSLLLLLNAAPTGCRFRIPPQPGPGRFAVLLSTAGVALGEDGTALVPARSLALLSHRLPA
jgi:glycogen operon protein